MPNAKRLPLLGAFLRWAQCLPVESDEEIGHTRNPDRARVAMTRRPVVKPMLLVAARAVRFGVMGVMAVFVFSPGMFVRSSVVP